MFTDNFNFEILKQINDSEKELFEYMENYKYDEYLKKLFSFMNDLNNYVDKSAPWVLKKTDPEQMKKVLANICLCIIRVSQYLVPFMPSKTSEVFNLFENTNNIKLDIFDNFKEVINLKFLKIRQPEPLFTKIE